MGRQGSGRAAQRKAKDIDQTLMCSLEELYLGATRKMKISRQASRGQGRVPRGHTQDEDKQAGKQGAGGGT